MVPPLSNSVCQWIQRNSALLCLTDCWSRLHHTNPPHPGTHMRKIILGFVLLACSSSWAANATSNTHNIELIIFRQTQMEPVYSSRLAPDRLLAEIQPLKPEQIRISLLSNVTSKLTPENGYEILLHRAWLQNKSPRFVSYALTSGEESFGHHP